MQQITFRTDTKEFLTKLRVYRDVLSKQTIKTLRGQALSGNLEGAKKGLSKIIDRRGDRCDRA